MPRGAHRDDRADWIDHLRGQGFPLEAYHSNQTGQERWEELARWHEELRRKWKGNLSFVGCVRTKG